MLKCSGIIYLILNSVDSILWTRNLNRSSAKPFLFS